MRPLPTVPATHLGVFTTHTALDAGWTHSALAHATATGRLVRVCRGVFVSADGWDDRGPQADDRRFAVRSAAATLSVGRSVASHCSAAVLAGLPLWHVPERPCITVPPHYTGDSRAAHLHRASLAVWQVIGTDGLLRTRCARTVLDIAREHGIENAVVAGDAALAGRLVDIARLERCAEFCAGWPGTRRAMHVLSLLDGRAESPLESISRLRFAEARLPPPEPQVDIFGLDGRWLGRLDFYWEEFGVAGEVDGRSKYRGDPDEAFLREKRRQELMEDTNLTFVRWGRRDLDDMSTLVARLAAGFSRGLRRVSDRRWRARPSPPPGFFAPPVHTRTA